MHLCYTAIHTPCIYSLHIHVHTLISLLKTSQQARKKQREEVIGAFKQDKCRLDGSNQRLLPIQEEGGKSLRAKHKCLEERKDAPTISAWYLL